MEQLLLKLLIGIVLIAFCLTAIFVYLSYKRLKEQRQKQFIDQYIREHGTDVYLYLVEGDELAKELIPDTPIKMQAMEAILIRYAKNIQDDTVQSRLRLYTEKYMHDFYKKKLQSKRWHIRMNTLNRVADFRMHGLLDDVLAMMSSSKSYSKEEYLHIYSILSTFKHESFFSYLLDPKCELGEFDYKIILYPLDSQQIETLSQQFDHLQPVLQTTLLEMIGKKGLIDFVSFLEQRLNSDSSEIRIRALKAMNDLGFIRQLKLITPFIQSAYWEERMMAAKLLAYDDSLQSLNDLRDLLQDSSWWVRSQAAKSIRSRKQGTDVLRSVLSTSQDLFAVDIAKEVLGEERSYANIK